MLRGFFLAIVMLAAAGPARAADDLELCRNRKPDAAQRQEACEKLIAAGQAERTRISRSRCGCVAAALLTKRETDKAIAAFGAALDADPENVPALVSRGYAHERKGDDDLAMADYNRVLQKCPNAPLALNNRGTLYLRKGALQSALDDFNAAIKSNPKHVPCPHQPRRAC